MMNSSHIMTLCVRLRTKILAKKIKGIKLISLWIKQFRNALQMSLVGKKH